MVREGRQHAHGARSGRQEALLSTAAAPAEEWSQNVGTNGATAHSTTPWHRSTVPEPRSSRRSKMTSVEHQCNTFVSAPDCTLNRSREQRAPRGPRAVSRAHGDHEARPRRREPAQRPLLCHPRQLAPSWIMSATRTRKSMSATQPSQTTLVRPSCECGQWPCQAPSHSDKACGLGTTWTDGGGAKMLFPEPLKFLNSGACVVRCSATARPCRPWRSRGRCCGGSANPG